MSPAANNSNGEPAASLPVLTSNRLPEGRRSPSVVATMPPLGDAPQSQFSMLLNSLRRQWLAAVILGVLCGVPAVLGAWLLQRPQFTSAAFLRISASDTPLVFETADRSGRNDYKTYKNTQRQLILTPFVLSAALRDQEISSLPILKEEIDPIAWLQETLVVDFPGDAELMRVSLTERNGPEAQKIVNAIVQAYMNEVVVNQKNERIQRLDNLQRVYGEAESKARTKRGELRSLAGTLGTSDTESLSLAQQLAVQHFGMVRNELTKTQFEAMRAKGELEMLTAQEKARKEQKDLPNPADPAQQKLLQLVLDEQIERDPLSVKLRSDIEGIVAAVTDAQQRLTESAAAPYVKNYQEQLKTAENQLAERRNQLRERTIERAQVGGDGGTAALSLKVALLKHQEKQLVEEVAKLEEETKKYGRSSVDVEMMRAEIEGLDAVVSRVGEEIERTKIELKSDSRIVLLSDARTSIKDDKKKQIGLTAMAGLVGLFLPVGLLLWRDVSRRRVDNFGTVGNIGLNVLGGVPHMPSRVLRQLRASPAGDMSSRWGGQLQDSVGSVAAMITRLGSQENMRVILISSAVSGEGKSSLSCHLAQSLAMSGHKTLLVDFDLRRPSLHKMFAINIQPGLVDVLQGAMQLEAAIQTTECRELHILAAGCSSPNLQREAARGSVAKLIGDVRSEYDFIIMDGSPILPVPDTRVLAQFADGVVLSVLRDVSQLPSVSAARDILTDFNVPVLGVVVTGCSEGLYYSTNTIAVSAE